MTEKLQKSIRDIRALAPKLNKATDEAHAAITAVEMFLNKCGIGMSYYAVSETESCERGERQLALYYGRGVGPDTNKFQIRVSSWIVENSGEPNERIFNEETRPWNSAPPVSIACSASAPAHFHAMHTPSPGRKKPPVMAC